jgi:DNA-binding transcriptional ArsR family regulator
MDIDQAAVDLFKTLGHPVRLQVIEVLAEEGEACVCHLAWRLGLRQAYLSQQLARLRQVGLVKDQRHGLNIFYSLAAPEIAYGLKALKQGMSELIPGTSRIENTGADRSMPCPCPHCNPDA